MISIAMMSIDHNSNKRFALFTSSSIISGLQSSFLFITTDGVAVILTILTMLSTPILTKIFGDGSLEVYREMPNTHYILFVNFIKRNQNCILIVSNLKGLASYCKAETTFTFHFSILTLSNAFLGIDNREMKSESGFSFAIASKLFSCTSTDILVPR